MKKDWLAQSTLGEPDNRGAFMYRNSKITIELEETIPDCKKVSVWTRRVAWKKQTFSVEISSDGKHWTRIGKKTCTSYGWTQYDFHVKRG